MCDDDSTGGESIDYRELVSDVLGHHAGHGDFSRGGGHDPSGPRGTGVALLPAGDPGAFCASQRKYFNSLDSPDGTAVAPNGGCAK